MKFLLKNIATAIVALMLFNCSVEQLDSRLEENNREASNFSSTFNCTSGICGARISNNGTSPVDLVIYDNNGDVLYEEQNIPVGSITDWQSFPIGQISYEVIRYTDGFAKKVTIDMAECMVYDMVFAENDSLTSDQATSGL